MRKGWEVLTAYTVRPHLATENSVEFKVYELLISGVLMVSECSQLQ